MCCQSEQATKTHATRRLRHPRREYEGRQQDPDTCEKSKDNLLCNE